MIYRGHIPLHFGQRQIGRGGGGHGSHGLVLGQQMYPHSVLQFGLSGLPTFIASAHAHQIANATKIMVKNFIFSSSEPNY